LSPDLPFVQGEGAFESNQKIFSAELQEPLPYCHTIVFFDIVEYSWHRINKNKCIAINNQRHGLLHKIVRLMLILHPGDPTVYGLLCLTFIILEMSIL
jgi:hypothetical protein